MSIDSNGCTPAGPQVIIPNFNWRYSGITAVNRTMAPLLARQFRVVWLGTSRPGQVAKLGVGSLLRLRFASSARRSPIVWHARRNVEMIVGLALKWLGFPLALIFTSVAQRHHTWITRFLIARMDTVIAASEAAAGYLQRPAVLVPHGIDTEVFRPPADRSAAFAATGLPGRYGIGGAFGRVRLQKGTDVFVEAMCRLLPKYPEWTAVLIGRVTLEHRAFLEGLRSRVEAAGLHDRVHFLGELPEEEVPLWYRRITVYAFTSREEGFGLTLLESMASGVALVAARAGAADTAVTPETGVLVSPGDVDALADAIEPLMRDPERAAAMGARARARVIAEFSLDTEAECIAAVYREVRARLQTRGAAPK